MTSLSCDKLVKSNGSNKTFRAIKVYRAVKKTQGLSFAVFNYSKYHPTPSQNDSTFAIQLRKNSRNPR